MTEISVTSLQNPIRKEIIFQRPWFRVQHRARLVFMYIFIIFTFVYVSVCWPVHVQVMELSLQRFVSSMCLYVGASHAVWLLYSQRCILLQGLYYSAHWNVRHPEIGQCTNDKITVFVSTLQVICSIENKRWSFHCLNKA